MFGLLKDGSEFPVEIGLNPIKTQEGTSRLIAVIDVSEKVRASERMTRAQESTLLGAEVARSNADLEQFVYVASHDLQEPLRAVIGYCQLLKHRYSERLDEEASTFLHHIVDGGERMQALVAGLLEYSRIGTRGRPLNSLDAGQAVHTGVQKLDAAIQESGARVDCGPLPVVKADEAQLALLFQNFLGNAIKFHGLSAPEINISAQNNGQEWMFSVRDNGIGFDPKHAQRIFIIFQRLHALTTLS